MAKLPPIASRTRSPVQTVREESAKLLGGLRNNWGAGFRVEDGSGDGLGLTAKNG